MLNPSVLLLDEPYAGINPALADVLTERLQGLAARGLTLLVVEHNLQMVRTLCERSMRWRQAGCWRRARRTPSFPTAACTRRIWAP